MLELFSQENNVILITGAAGGLGRSMALAFAQAGGVMAIVDIQLAGAEETADMIHNQGGKARSYQCDISKQKDIEALRQAVYTELGQVDVLVNNAGVFQDGAAEDIDFIGDWRRVMDVNVDGTFLMCQIFGRDMISRKSGCIINIASKSGIMADYPNKQTAYNTAKAANIMLTKSLAVEWAPYGVRVNCICPGNFVARPDNPVFQPGHPYREAWIKNTPMGHFGKPEELSTVALYLASSYSSFTTGAVEVVDGGFTLI